MKIIEIINLIKNWHEPFIPDENDRDQILVGNPDQECYGICISVCATMEVIQKAVEKKCNLIITHESIFFGGRLSHNEIIENDIYQEKIKYIKDNNLVIWRDHDRIHGNGLPHFKQRNNPDYIFLGICKELGWENYVLDDIKKPLFYKIPRMKANDLIDLFINKFNLNGVRTVGNLDCEIEYVYFCEHAIGGKNDGSKIMKAMNANVIIPFEICDYTLTQYILDASYLNQSKIIIEMGHFNCEELGMRYMMKWIREIVSDDIPIEFIDAGDIFKYKII